MQLETRGQRFSLGGEPPPIDGRPTIHDGGFGACHRACERARTLPTPRRRHGLLCLRSSRRLTRVVSGRKVACMQPLSCRLGRRSSRRSTWVGRRVRSVLSLGRPAASNPSQGAWIRDYGLLGAVRERLGGTVPTVVAASSTTWSRRARSRSSCAIAGARRAARSSGRRATPRTCREPSAPTRRSDARMRRLGTSCRSKAGATRRAPMGPTPIP